MNLKKIFIGLGWVSAIALNYFAIDILTSLGDWGRQWASDPKVLVAALFVTLPPASVVFLGIVLVEQAKKTRGIIWSLVGTHVPAWIWLFVGSIALALMRFQ